MLSRDVPTHIIHPPKPCPTSILRTSESPLHSGFARHLFAEVKLFRRQRPRVRSDMPVEIRFVGVGLVTSVVGTGVGFDAEMSGLAMRFQCEALEMPS